MKELYCPKCEGKLTQKTDSNVECDQCGKTVSHNTEENSLEESSAPRELLNE